MSGDGVETRSAPLEALRAALRAGRHDQALALASAATDAGLAHPLLLQVAAAALAQIGRFDEALALHEKAAGLAPADPAVRAAMGECLFAAQRPEAALAAWRQALDLAPKDPTLMCGKARVLASLGHGEEAAALFAAAQVADPGRLEAPFGLARLALEAGRLDEADRLVRALLARAPGQPDFLWLAGRLGLARGDHQAAAAFLEKIAAIPGLPAAQRAETQLALGEALDGLGRTSEAFALAVEAKAIQRRLYAGRAAGREGETARFVRLAAWFERADPDAWKAAPRKDPPADPAPTHAFLVGFPRSGTTLLEQALAGHPGVQTLEEAPTLAAHFAEFLSSAAGCARLARLDADQADAWRARYWAEARAHGIGSSGGLFVDKAPAGTLSLPLIAKLFPDAKILFALRDPRDVVLSCLRNAFQMNAMTYAFTTLEETAACYCACMAMAEVYRRVLALDLIEVRHEVLVEDFDGELARIAGFLGIDDRPAMRDVAATARRSTVRTPSGPQVRLGLNREGIGRWRAYAGKLAPVAGMLEPWVRRFGYPADGP